jgi:TP901 family phage tail tape measure protein
MAKTLSATISLVDQVSEKLANIANVGNDVAKAFNKIKNNASKALQSVDSAGNNASKAMQSVSESAEKMAKAVDTYNKESEGFVNANEEMAEQGKNVEEALSAQAEAAANVADESQNLGDVVEEYAEQAEKVSKKTEEYGDELEKTSKKTEEYGDELEKTSKKTEEHGDEIEKTSKKTEEYGDEIEKTSKKTEEYGEAISSLDQLIAGVGIVAALTKITKAFAECAAAAEEYETSIAKLQTIAGGSSIDSLSDDIMELSNNTGIAATDLADVAYNAISAGTAVEDAVDMAEAASKLAVAGFTDSSSALSVLTTAINAYGDAAGTAEEISDSLIMVQNLGVTTVAELSANMGKAIATASAYNVNLSNLESAYISTTKAGINTAESTTYISSMLKELGDSGSDVAAILADRTGESFGQLMSDGYSLADVLGILYDSVNQDGEALMNLWGSAEAGKAANAVISQGLEEFNENLEAVANSAGATAAAYSVMADTTAYAHERMNNAATNFEETIGSELNPTLEGLYNTGTKVLEWLTSVAEKCPQVTYLITSIVATLGTLIAVIGTFTVVTKLAAAAQALLDAAVTSTAAKIALEVGVAAAAVVGLGVLVSMLAKTSDGEDELTVASQKQADELAEMQSRYEGVCARQGEASDAAISLKSDIDDLTASYENSKQTVAEFYAELDSVTGRYEDTISSYNETNNSIRTQEVQTESLVNKLRELSSGTDEAGTAEAEMKSIVAELNQMYPELGISISDVNGNLDELVDKINAVAYAQSAQTKYNSASETLGELEKQQAELEAIRDEAYDNLVRAGEKYSNANWVQGTYAEIFGTGVAEGLSDAQDAYNKAQEDLDDCIAKMAECSETVAEYDDILNGTSEDTVDYSDAVSIAIGTQKDYIDELAAAYDEAYEAALSSIEGQYSLWQTADEVTATSIDDIMSSMESQISYWESYAESLENLQGRGIEGLDEMVASMDDGSAESAAALAAMAEASDVELVNMVNSFNDLQDAQAQTAADVADLETNFSESMSEIESDLETTVENMNMEDDAQSAAIATMQGYINGILKMKSGAVSAAESVSSATTEALSGSEVKGHAAGTTNSERFYLAGEEGPELIVSKGGDTVFPHSETERIINKVTEAYNMIPDEAAESVQEYALTGYQSSEADNIIKTASDYDDNPVMMAGTGAATSEVTNRTVSSEEKTVTLKIEGSGSVGVDKNTSPESLWESVKGNIKETFMSILKEEIYEEGAGVYEF